MAQWELEKERTSGAFSESQTAKEKRREREEAEKEVFREQVRVGR